MQVGATSPKGWKYITSSCCTNQMASDELVNLDPEAKKHGFGLSVQWH